MSVRNLFDEPFYLAKYPDVAASGTDPFSHYMTVGWAEYRDPSKFFSTGFYKNFYSDIKAGKDVIPLKHYAEFGVQELRDPSPFFDTSYYLQNNIDVANGVTNPLHHFMLFGNQEARNPTDSFDANFYLSSNPDVAAAVSANLTTAFEHFSVFGHKEGRDPSAIFNTTLYLEANLDVSASSFTAFEHYQYFGKAEGRRTDEIYTIPSGSSMVINGTSFAETITGSSGDDTFHGGGGNDTLDGLDGNDTITSGSGNDLITGGIGNDTLTANSGDNSIDGGTGDDNITAGTGTDLITGGIGNDTITLLTTPGNGTDTVIYSGRTDATNGEDTIATFQKDDVHNFSKVLTVGTISNVLLGSDITLATTAALAGGTSIAVTNQGVFVAEVALKNTIDTVADVATALAATGVLDALTFSASADNVLLLGGADDDTTHYIYGVDDGDGNGAIASSEIALMATVTTDITDGIRGLSTENLSFSIPGNGADNTIVGTSGNDIITTGNGTDIISGLAGNDNITLGTGSDTIIFSGLTSTLNGSDTISTFQSNDKYDFSNVLTGGQFQNANGNSFSFASTTSLSASTPKINVDDERIYIAEVANQADIDSSNDLSTALGSGVLRALSFAPSADAILIVGGSGTQNQYIYGIDNDGNASIFLSEISLLGTITTDFSLGIQGLSSDNFIL